MVNKSLQSRGCHVILCAHVCTDPIRMVCTQILSEHKFSWFDRPDQTMLCAHRTETTDSYGVHTCALTNQSKQFGDTYPVLLLVTLVALLMVALMWGFLKKIPTFNSTVFAATNKNVPISLPAQNVMIQVFECILMNYTDIRTCATSINYTNLR